MILSSICTVKTMEKSWKINIKHEKTRLFYEFHSKITPKYRKTQGNVEISMVREQLLPKKHRVFDRFPLFYDKQTKKHVYITVLTRPKRRKHGKTHGFESKKLQIREFSVESGVDANQVAATSGETLVKCAKVERHTLRKRKGSFYGFV